ncbi:hypothetical protein [Marinicella sp. W31]|uniref:hypothetical protein n=1 Tax=Marinicella sp. W31 TaxID=3023713 RepID=UPI0037575DFE
MNYRNIQVNRGGQYMLFLRDLFMLRSRGIGREMVSQERQEGRPKIKSGKIRLHRLMRRKYRRKQRKTQQTVRLKQARYR